MEVFRVDVAKGEDVVALFKAVGEVDILVNNAGVSLFKQIQDVEESEIDTLLSVNVKSAILCAREVCAVSSSSQKKISSTDKYFLCQRVKIR